MVQNIVCLIVLFTTFVYALGQASQYVSSQTCPYAWSTKRFSETWPCYLFTNKIKRTWSDAQKFCEGMGGNLLVLQTPQERDWVFNVLKSYTGFYRNHTEWWIGLHDITGADIHWADGTPLQDNLIPWVAGEPGKYDHNKPCVEYINGSVRHQDCSIPQFFVCKRPRESAIWCDAAHGWESVNQMCYKVVTKLLSWDDGRAECQKENGDLVVVGDLETERDLFQFVESRRANLWIGLREYRNTTGGYYVWETKDGTSKLNAVSSYFNSQTALQDVVRSDSNQSCVFANYSLSFPNLWQNGNCGERRFSLCQKPKERCSAGWIENEYNCYLLVARPKANWTDAKDYCDQRGATLLHIQSSNDQNFINSNLGAFRSRGIGSIWLGLSVNSSSRGVWADGGVFTPYSPYIYNNLNGQNLTSVPGLHCYTIYTDDANGTWQVANDCMSNKSFVCQIRAQRNPKIPTTPAPTGSTISAVSTIPTTPVTWSTDCGPFWIKDSKTGYCYKFSDNTMTWFEARHNCENEGAQLTSINTYHEETFITDFVYGFQSDALWIGVNNLNTHSGYNWIDGSGFGYINWAPGEPNNVHDNEHCAEFIVGGDRNGQWNDINCSERRGYICKKKSTDFATLPPLTTPVLPAGKIFGCPDANWLGYGNNCFLIERSNLSWTDARKYCEGQGYNLASIANQNEQNFLFSQIQPDKEYKDSDQYWIGLNDQEIQMIFKWTDGTPVRYTNWDDKEPNNFLDRREDCVTIYHWDGKWNDAPCYTSRIGFICKTPKAVLPSTAIQANLGQGCSVPGSLAYGYMCYLIKRTPQTWDDANLDCVANHGTLATVHDRYQQAFLASQIANTIGHYWIGMSDKVQLGHLQWIDGKSLDYTAWSGNHTGNAKSICISMRTGGPIVGLWVDQSCLIQQKYICEFPRAGYSTPKVTTTTTLTPPVCPSGWPEYNGYCYKFYTGDSERQTWFGARDSCRAIGADLISLHSSDEQSKVFSYRNSGYRYGVSYWIGLSDFGIEKQYQWTDGTAVDFTSWSRGEPNDNDGTDDCVELYSPGLKWNDNTCYVAKSYACKIKKGNTLQTTIPTQPTTAAVECAAFPGWKLLNGYCYFTSDNVGQNSRRTWYRARAYCNQQGAELASIHSEPENNNLVTLLSFTTKSDAWIGLRDVGQNQFKWSDGSLVDYTKWQGNEPNDAFGSEKCAQLVEYNGHWNDNDCNENYHFICKKKPGSSSPITPSPTSQIHGECPAGYTGVNSGNKCFKVFGARDTSARKEYTKARDACRSQGTNFDIASFNSRIELATVVSLLNGLVLDNSDLWIGLNDQNNNQRYTWQDSSQLLITSWDKGQPTRWGGKCVAMSSDNRHAGKWHNLRCSTVRPYICEALRDPTIAPTRGFPACQRQDYISNGLDCYKVHNAHKTYSQATAACKAEQAYLTSIMSIYEQAYIDTLIENIDSPVWTGLRDPGNTGTYSWADSSPVIYTNWNKGEPTYMSGEGCVSTNRGFWNDSMCLNLYPFVCKVLFFTPPPPTGYPSGYCKDVTWRQNDDFCYYFSFDSPGKTWSQADRDCVSRGMQLVSITNRNEESFLLRELDQSSQNSVDLWLGFKRLNGYFQWSDGTQVAYINWESNPGSNDCVKLKTGNGKWKDANCENHNGFVCKTPKLPATSPTTPTTTISTTPTTTVLTSSTMSSGKIVSQSPSVNVKSSTSISSQPSKMSSQKGNIKTSSVTVQSSLQTQTIPSNVNSAAKLQQQTTVVGTDLSAGQIAGIIIGVAIVLVIACGVLFFLKRRSSGSLFNFSTLRNEGGFDNAAYDKQMQSVQINGKEDNEQHVNGFAHGFSDLYDTDA